ncbi:SLATT domain-containing protein [Rhodovulum sp. DZ06]|uniref:SLATT domain-containing protein n=1 Tax=Rhodovulum sp. DZ06 TaxID=3425126 RepID=UPI003D35593E
MDDIQMLKSWHARTRAIEKSHFRACVRYRRKKYLWGGAMIALTTLSAALTGMVEANGAANPWLTGAAMDFTRIALAMAAPVAAVLTFLGFQTRSTEHHHAAARYAAIKRRISITVSRRENVDAEDQAQGYDIFERVCAEWDQATADSPPLYRQDWHDVRLYEREIGLSRPGEATARMSTPLEG